LALEVLPSQSLLTWYFYGLEYLGTEATIFIPFNDHWITSKSLKWPLNPIEWPLNDHWITIKSYSEISYRWCLTTLVVKRIWLSRPSRWCCFVAPRRLVRRSVGSRLMGQDAKRWRTLQNGWFMMVYEWFKIWHMQKWLILWAHVSHITAKFDPFPNRRNFTAAPPLQCPLFRHRCAAQISTARLVQLVVSSDNGLYTTPNGKCNSNSNLVGGIPTPLKNMKVSWDDYSQYMESHKIHVPNHQPVIEHPREFWVTYCQNNTILSIFCGTVFWIYSKRSTFWGSPTKQGILHQFNGVGLDPRYSKLSFSSWVWYIPNYRNTDWRSVSEFYYVLSIQMACPQVRHP